MGAVPDTMFSVVEVPWHGIGTIVPNKLTAAEALAASGLDWQVELRPVFDADMAPIDGFFAPTRLDNAKPLGIVKSRYHVIQNADGFDFVDSIIGDGSAKFETAGSLFGGKVVFITAVLPDEVKVGGDEIKPYFLLKTTHDGSGGLRVLTTPVRTVCENTLNMALKSAVRSMTIRHTKSYEDKLGQAREVLNITRTYYKSFVEFATELVNEKMQKSAFEALMNELLPVPKDEGRGRTNALVEQDKLMSAYNATDLDNIRGTKWGVYNAIADYSDHSRKQVGDATTRAENAFLRTFEGTDLKDRALALLTA